MASTAFMIRGAVLNAAVFTDGNSLAQYLEGKDPKKRWKRKSGITKQLKHNTAMAKYTCDHIKLLD